MFYGHKSNRVWVWEANAEEVAKAEEALDKLERDKALEDETKRLEALKKAAIDSIDDQIDRWERYKEQWSSVADNYKSDQDRLIAEQVLGTQLEGDNWKTRLGNLREYAKEYRDIMSQIGANESAQNVASGNNPNGSNTAVADQMKKNSEAWHNASPEEKKELEKANENLGNSSGMYRKDGVWYDSSGKRAYAEGGVVDFTGNAMVHGSKDRPEVMINNKQASNLYKFIRSLGQNGASVKPIEHGGSVSGDDFSGAQFTIITNADTFDKLVRDIRIKTKNR